jgi:hypothetical protein
MSIKYQASILNGDYLGSESIELDFPCEIHFTRFGTKQYRSTMIANGAYENINFIDDQNYKVFVCSNEPSSSASREINPIVIHNAFQYDLILTSEKEILDNASNAVFFPYGTTWLNKSKHHIDALGSFDEELISSISCKKFNVSFLTTNHRNKDGYELRHFVWNNRSMIKIPTIFYSSTRGQTTQRGYSDTLHDGLLPNDDKMHLFHSQFSIAIESTRENSYFSEKLIDCLLTKTVPIYWGASNIGEFFDTRGFIVFDDLYDFYQKINSLTPETYETMKPYIEANYEKAKEYGRTFFSRIKDKIKENYKKQKSKKDILWTIGILTLPERKQDLEKLLKHLDHITGCRYSDRIEVLVNEDNGEHTVGHKRNEILAMAKGKYISFIDDDDMVSVSYINKIAEVLDIEKYDGIGFLGMLYYTKIPTMMFNHSNKNPKCFRLSDKRTQYGRLNHLNPIKIHIARECGFPNISFSEDSEYSDRLFQSGLIKDEKFIDEIFYHYLFDENKSKTHTSIT